MVCRPERRVPTWHLDVERSICFSRFRHFISISPNNPSIHSTIIRRLGLPRESPTLTLSYFVFHEAAPQHSSRVVGRRLRVRAVYISTPNQSPRDFIRSVRVRPAHVSRYYSILDSIRRLMSPPIISSLLHFFDYTSSKNALFGFVNQVDKGPMTLHSNMERLKSSE